MRGRWATWTAALGCVAVLGYGGLKASWALGATIGLSDPAQLYAADRRLTLAGWLFAYWGTVALAVLAAAILLALVMPWGAVVPRPVVRTLAWLGALMVVPGLLGLVMILAYLTGIHRFGADSLGGLYAATYVVVYACFLVLGLAFAATAYLTRQR